MLSRNVKLALYFNILSQAAKSEIKGNYGRFVDWSPSQNIQKIKQRTTMSTVSSCELAPIAINVIDFYHWNKTDMPDIAVEIWQLIQTKLSYIK